MRQEQAASGEVPAEITRQERSDDDVETTQWLQQSDSAIKNNKAVAALAAAEGPEGREPSQINEIGKY